MSSWSAVQWRVLAVAYLAYMCKTFGEAAFDLTTPARQKGALSLSDGATASLLSIGSFSYLSGKLLLGAVGDMLGGRALFAGSLALAGIAFWGMSLAGSHFDLCVGWGVANFVLAAPWSGMLLCVSGSFGIHVQICNYFWCTLLLRSQTESGWSGMASVRR